MSFYMRQIITMYDNNYHLFGIQILIFETFFRNLSQKGKY